MSLLWRVSLHLVNSTKVFMWSQKAKFMANMGPTWVLLALDGPHVGPMKLAIRVCKFAGYMSMMTNLYHNLCYRLDNSSSSVMYSHHLISKYAIRWRLFFHLQCCQVEGKKIQEIWKSNMVFKQNLYVFSHYKFNFQSCFTDWYLQILFW